MCLLMEFLWPQRPLNLSPEGYYRPFSLHFSVVAVFRPIFLLPPPPLRSLGLCLEHTVHILAGLESASAYTSWILSYCQSLGVFLLLVVVVLGIFVYKYFPGKLCQPGN